MSDLIDDISATAQFVPYTSVYVCLRVYVYEFFNVCVYLDHFMRIYIHYIRSLEFPIARKLRPVVGRHLLRHISSIRRQLEGSISIPNLASTNRLRLPLFFKASSAKKREKNE